LTGLLESERDFQRITNAASEIGNSKWYMYDRANAELDKVRSAARRMVLMHGCDILYVDYLQIISGQGRQESKYDHITKVSMALKQLARDLRVPVVVAAQLNRAAHEKKPHMGELKESGQIEQDADAVMLLHRPNRDEEMRDGREIWAVTLIVDKNRDGALGEVHLHFNAPLTLFTEAPKPFEE
jgi:replicative DNA helicase